MKIVTLCVMLVLSLYNLQAQTSEKPLGSGSEINPYKISNLSNLYWLTQTDSIWGDTLFFEQTNDIDALETSAWDNGAGFLPIGNHTTGFTGHYNGMNYKISNLYINRAKTDCVGLFGVIIYSFIDSIVIKNVSIKGRENVGGVLGSEQFSKISNCTVSGNISGTLSVGGVIGANFKTTVTTCNSSANVSGKQYIGGVVGYHYYSSYMTDCYSTGSIFGETHVGGLVGDNYNSNIKDSYNSGKVSGTASIGGVAGYTKMNATIVSSYNTGEISGSSNVGGIVGYNYGCTISTSYNSGSITGTTGSIGGLAGYNYNSTIENSYNTGAINGKENTGGAVGFNIYNGTISNCYSSGQVAATTNVGGFVGRNNGSTISNCVWGIETSTMNSGIGEDDNSQSVTGLSTTEMKNESNFTSWDINTVWAIRSGNTYPSLLSVNNAPFAFGGESAVGTMYSVLDNDYDYETLQNKLVLNIIGARSLKTGTYYTNAMESVSLGDSLEIVYRLGERRSADTLWGNIATETLVSSTDDVTDVTTQKLSIMEGFSLIVAPTPTKDSGKLMFSSEERGEVTFTILNENEKLISRKIVEVYSTEMTILNWDVISLLPKGNYYVVMRVNGEEKAVVSLIKI